MSILTDFFVASPSELLGAFPEMAPAAKEPIERDGTNPFTGQPCRIREWIPDPNWVKSESVAGPAGITHLPHYLCKRIDHVKLAQLQHLLCGTDLTSAVRELTAPALVADDGQESGESGVHHLPDQLTEALANVPQGKLSTMAAKWANTEEMQLDGATSSNCELVLAELVRLGQLAQREQKGLYLSWSL